MSPPSPASRPPTRSTFAAIALLAGSMLMYEILLTRICSLRLLFHFGFLVVSNCLLGIGASGVAISVLQDRLARRQELWIWLSALAYVLSLALVYPLLLAFPLDVQHSWQEVAPLGFWRFSLFNGIAAIPFFTGGAAVGMILTFNAQHINRVYASDLLGAGLGCLVCPLFLWMAGAGGCFMALTLVALAGAVATTPAPWRRPARALGAAAGLAGALLLPGVDARFPVPAKMQIQLTRDVGVELSDRERYSRWSAIGRVDVVPVEKTFVFGRGKNPSYTGPLPEERLIVQDGWAGTFIMNFGERPEALDVLANTLYSTSFRLKDRPRAFVIGVGGGHDIWAAKLADASYVKGVELHQQVLDIHRDFLRDYSGGIVEDPDIELVHAEGRSELMREEGEFDVVQMTGIDTWSSLTSGGYMLAENYLYTVEALETMFDRLAPDGVIQITRLGLEMELLRMLSNAHAAFETRGAGDFARSVVCLSASGLITVIAKKRAFTPQELQRLGRITREAGIRVLYGPGRSGDGVVADFLRAPDKRRFIDEFPRNIAPTTDDIPYFFNFTRWDSPLRASKYLHEPTHVSQGNPLFIFGQLGVSLVAAGALILLPVAVFRGRGIVRRSVGRFLVYFSGVGLGFIIIEIVLMQKLVLFLGHPLFSLSVTLFSLLIFTGIGSLLSERWFRAPTRAAWLVPGALALLLLGFTASSTAVVNAFIDQPTAVRIGLATLALAPIGVVLGIPFAYGIRLVNHVNPTLVPWAWAVNAFATVVGSIATVILSMNFGFNAALLVALLLYVGTFLSVHGLVDTAGR